MLKKYRLIISFIIIFTTSLLLYFMYGYLVNLSLNPVKIPVANSYIASGSKISINDINYVDIPKSMVIEDVYLNEEELIGKYVNSYNALAKGSMFYKELLTKTDEINDTNSLSLKANEVAIPIDVDVKTSYANSIIKGQSIDVYFQGYATNEDEKDEKVLYGLLVKNARVVAVYDKDGQNIDQNNENDTAIIVLALSYDQGDLVQRAKFYGEVIPIVSYESLSDQDNSYYDINKIRDIIYQRAIDVKLTKVNEENG